MTRRNVGGMLLGLIASVTAAIASCSFPTYEITVTGTSGSAGGASATASSGSVGGGGNGGASSTGTTSSGSSASSASSSSASSTGSGFVCVGGVGGDGGSGDGGDGGVCDCDDDKALATSCAMGTDCNDHNALVFPGQKSFFKDKIAGSVNDYDYDCNGKEDYEVTVVIGCAALNCNTTAVGWKNAVPPCGASGQFGTCKFNGLACIESIQGTQVQRCR